MDYNINFREWDKYDVNNKKVKDIDRMNIREIFKNE
jgi:hypothetical protein